MRYVVVGPDARVQHERRDPGRRPADGARHGHHRDAGARVRPAGARSTSTWRRRASGLPYVWRPDEAGPARRAAAARRRRRRRVVRAPQCFVFHPLNAYDLARRRARRRRRQVAEDLRRRRPHAVPATGRTTLVRWTVDPSSGQGRRGAALRRHPGVPALRRAPRRPPAPLRLHERVRPRRRSAGGVHKHDLEQGTTERVGPGPTASAAARPCSCPAEGQRGRGRRLAAGVRARRGHGVVRPRRARRPGPRRRPRGPVHLPQRVPAGFHGNWSPTPT